MRQTSGLTAVLYSVQFTDDVTGTIVGEGGTILRTFDEGQTWTLQASGTTNALNEVFFTSTHHGTVVGLSGTILTTTTGGVVTSIEHAPPVQGPSGFRLEQNYPNPFNPATTIRYELAVDAHVVLTISTPLGQNMVTLVDALQSAGTHQVRFEARKLATGLYFYTLRAGNVVATRKLLLTK